MENYKVQAGLRGCFNCVEFVELYHTDFNDIKHGNYCQLMARRMWAAEEGCSASEVAVATKVQSEGICDDYFTYNNERR